jgi:hypothetical protein
MQNAYNSSTDGSPRPASPQRRVFERTQVRANALIHGGGHFQHVCILDFSRGGLLLDGTFGLIEKDAIDIELLSGLRITARVVWSLGRRTGVAFAEPLAEEHPLLAELSRRAARAGLSSRRTPSTPRAPT